MKENITYKRVEKLNELWEEKSIKVNEKKKKKQFNQFRGVKKKWREMTTKMLFQRA